MAPRGRRGDGGDSAEPQAFHELGVRGRKTGKVLRDTGERDEHGMQPLEDIFSSPRKREDNGAVIDDGNSDEDGDGSEDMEISSSGGPGPRTVLRRSMQNRSSPSQDSNNDTSVSRKLDFSGSNKPKANGKPKGRALNGNGSFHRDDSEDIEAMMGGGDDELVTDSMGEASMMMVEGGGEGERREEQQPTAQQKRGRGRPKMTPNLDLKAAPKLVVASRPAKVPSPSPEPQELVQPEELEVVVEEEEEEEIKQEPVPKKRGRPPTKASHPQQELPPPDKPSKKRRSINGEPAGGTSHQPEQEDGTPRKKQRTLVSTASKPGPSKPQAAEKRKAAAFAPAPTAKPSGRGRPGRRPKSLAPGSATGASKGDEGETSFAHLQRGPPMPKSRGLVSVQKDDTITRTRSGRSSYRPIAFWRGEQAVLEEEEQDDIFNRKGGFVMASIKEVRRVPLDEPPNKRAASRGKGRPKMKKAVQDEEQLEEWETNPGVVEGEIVIWEPEHEEHPPADDEAVQVTDERIAISAKSIQTSDIRDATFRFAKTLTMPFMGAGVVDLPPGGEKRPKNSRKMHMVFFVHYGKVMVTINEAQFRISAGGMWFVPRGNYYSITNDYDKPSRVFFCQACELSTAAFADSTQLSMG